MLTSSCVYKCVMLPVYVGGRGQCLCNSNMTSKRLNCVAVQGKELKGEVEGILAMKQSWPSIMRTLFGDHKRYEETYFSAYKVSCYVCCKVLCSALLCCVVLCCAVLTASETHIHVSCKCYFWCCGLPHLWTALPLCDRMCVCVRVQGYYFTGDGCRRDEDGYFWITGQPSFNLSVHSMVRLSNHHSLSCTLAYE